MARDRAKQHGNDPGVLVLTCLGGGEPAGWPTVLTTVIITGTCNHLISFPILALAKQTATAFNGLRLLSTLYLNKPSGLESRASERRKQKKLVERVDINYSQSIVC